VEFLLPLDQPTVNIRASGLGAGANYNPSMYNFVLTTHSWLRWAVVIAGLIAIVRGIAGAAGRRPWTRADERAGFWFVTFADLQMLLGLVLYFALSPITRTAMQDFGGAMRSAGVRFWAVEHVFGMIVAVVLAHVGRSRTKKLTNDAARHKVAAICFVLAFLAILISIPWPGLPNGRPLFRSF
jgi:hypothetical protein